MTDAEGAPGRWNPRRYALASKLFGSGVVAQACGFLATAFAATRTSPGDFALFAAVTAATAVLGSVNSLAAESRVPVVGESAARALNRAGFAAIVGFSLATAAVGVAGFWSAGVWGVVALFTAWSSFMLGVQHLLIGIILRSQRQELLARNRLVQGIVNAVLIVGFVLGSLPGFYALSLAWAVSMTVSNAALLPRIRGWGSGFTAPRAGDFTRLRAQVHLQPVSNLLSDAVGQIPLLVLPALGSPAVSGAWAAASRFITPVVNMAQLTLQPIYYGRAAELLRAGDTDGFQQHHRRWTRLLAFLAVPVALGCFVAVEWLIPLLGPEWRVASAAVIPACLVFPVAVSWLPLSQTLILSGHLRAQLVWTAAQFALTIVPFAAALAGWITAWQALVAWSVVSAGSMLAHHVIQRRPPVEYHGGVDDLD